MTPQSRGPAVWSSRSTIDGLTGRAGKRGITRHVRVLVATLVAAFLAFGSVPRAYGAAAAGFTGHTAAGVDAVAATPSPAVRCSSRAAEAADPTPPWAQLRLAPDQGRRHHRGCDRLRSGRGGTTTVGARTARCGSGFPPRTRRRRLCGPGDRDGGHHRRPTDSQQWTGRHGPGGEDSSHSGR